MTNIGEMTNIEEDAVPPVGHARRSFSLVRTQRTLQIVLGLFWLLDAGLQFQPFMFGSGFTTTYLLNNAQGSPTSSGGSSPTSGTSSAPTLPYGTRSLPSFRWRSGEGCSSGARCVRRWPSRSSGRSGSGSSAKAWA